MNHSKDKQKHNEKTNQKKTKQMPWRNANNGWEFVKFRKLDKQLWSFTLACYYVHVRVEQKLSNAKHFDSLKIDSIRS